MCLRMQHIQFYMLIAHTGKLQLDITLQLDIYFQMNIHKKNGKACVKFMYLAFNMIYTVFVVVFFSFTTNN